MMKAAGTSTTQCGATTEKTAIFNLKSLSKCLLELPTTRQIRKALALAAMRDFVKIRLIPQELV